MTAFPRAALAPDDAAAVLRIQVLSGVDHPAWAAVVALRDRVFRREQGFAEAASSDSDDQHSLHALAWLTSSGAVAHADRLVGVGRMTFNREGRNEALIAWVATAPEARHRGVGSAVMRALLAEADAAGIAETLLAAQRHAEGFYGRLGFFAVGAPYTARGVAHRWMVRQRPV